MDGPRPTSNSELERQSIHTRGWENLQISPFISETVRIGSIVTTGHYPCAVSVPMTLSDIENRDAKDQTFPEDLFNYTPAV